VTEKPSATEWNGSGPSVVAEGLGALVAGVAGEGVVAAWVAAAEVGRVLLGEPVPEVQALRPRTTRAAPAMTCGRNLTTAPNTEIDGKGL